MSAALQKSMMFALRNAPIFLFAAVFLVFSFLSPRFFTGQNMVNILIQSSSAAVVATGMTFVLLVGGIDLSVGSIMFLSAAIAGKAALGGVPVPLAVLAILVVGILYGCVNAFFVSRLKIMAFVVTLATLYAGRGLGLLVSQTRAMNLPESFLAIGSSSVLGIPFPVLLSLLVVAAAQLVLGKTPFGRHIYAVGHDPDGAVKAGLETTRILASVYVISGFCAALGGIVSVAQLGAVSPTFGKEREFAAISASVLGGTSLFGGRGQVFPGTVLGAVLIQTVETGLNIINADPYVYPLILGAIIFLAVLIDSLRHRQLAKLGRRKIRGCVSPRPA